MRVSSLLIVALTLSAGSASAQCAAFCQSCAATTCSSCQNAHYLSANACPDCTPVNNCVSALTCTSATTSRCAQCAASTWLDTSQRPAGADRCTACTDINRCVAQETCSTA